MHFDKMILVKVCMHTSVSWGEDSTESSLIVQILPEREKKGREEARSVSEALRGSWSLQGRGGKFKQKKAYDEERVDDS